MRWHQGGPSVSRLRCFFDTPRTPPQPVCPEQVSASETLAILPGENDPALELLICDCPGRRPLPASPRPWPERVAAFGMAQARSPAKLWEVSACDLSRSTIIRAAAAQKRAAFGMTGTCPATEYWEVRSRDPRRSTIARWTAACK